MQEKIAKLAGGSAQVIAYGVLTVALLYTLWKVIPGPLVYLVKKCPLWSGESVAWFTSREWVVVFAFVNAIIFVFSLHNALQSTGKSSFWALFVDNWLTCGQIAALLLLINLVVHPATDGHPVIQVASETRGTLMIAMSLGLVANILALLDSIGRYATGDIGPTHFWGMWIWQNIGCLLFFGFLLWKVLVRDFDYLNSPRVAWLWILSAALLVISYFDLTVDASR